MARRLVRPSGPSTVAAIGAALILILLARALPARAQVPVAPKGMVWKARYNGPADGSDDASVTAVSPDGATVFVTGTSFGSATQTDWATVAYDSATGAERWATRFTTQGYNFDAPAAMAVSTDGELLFVTGRATVESAAITATVAYDATTGVQRWTATDDGAGGTALQVSPDGATVLVTGSRLG